MTVGNFTVEIDKRDLSANPVPPNIEWTVNNFSHSAIGGPKEASFTGFGKEADIWNLINLLRSPVRIYGPDSDPVWWGYIESVQVRVGWISIEVSVENMTNRVAVAHTAYDARMTTDWAQNDISVAAYGIKETLIPISNVTDDQANKRRDTELEARKFPISNIEFAAQEEGSYSAAVRCRGWFDTLDWRYYDQPKGLEQNNVSGQGKQKMGARYTASTISFVSSCLIQDAASGLRMFDKGDVVAVSGTASNNRYFTIREGTSSGYEITVDMTSACTITEASGTSFTLSTASQVWQEFAQTSGSSWDVSAVYVRAATIGSPSDYLVALIYGADPITGNPSVPLASGSVISSSVTDGSTEWIEIPLSACLTISSGASPVYWLGITRSSSTTSGSNYYELDINEELPYLAGSMAIYTGASYVARDPDADLLFRVTGTQKTTEQIREILQNSAQFINAIDIAVDSGVETPQFRDGETTALTELTKLLETGTASGRRLLAKVDHHRRLKVYQEPVSDDTTNYRIKSDKIIRNYMDSPISQWDIPVGIWVNIIDVIPGVVNTQLISNPTEFFLEETDYYVERDILAPRSRNARDPWSSGKVEEG